jgi:hypothetical protein
MLPEVFHWNGLLQRLECTSIRPFAKEADTSALQSVCLSAARCLDSEYQVCIILNAALSLTKHLLSRRPTVSANTVVFSITAIMAKISMLNNPVEFHQAYLRFLTSSNDVLELQIDAPGTQYAADVTSQRAYGTLIDGDQWMIYRNVETNVLHWDFVSPPSFQPTA